MERQRNLGPVFPFANTVPDYASLIRATRSAHPGHQLQHGGSAIGPFEQRQALGDSGGTVRDVSARNIPKFADDNIHRSQQIDVVGTVVRRRCLKSKWENV